MGMSGMTTDAYASYASATNEKKVEVANDVKPSHDMTVAEFRNAMNPMTKYYDKWSIRSFLDDESISAKTKIEVLCGKLIAEVTNEDTWKTIFNKGKGI